VVYKKGNLKWPSSRNGSLRRRLRNQNSARREKEGKAGSKWETWMRKGQEVLGGWVPVKRHKRKVEFGGMLGDGRPTRKGKAPEFGGRGPGRSPV